MSNTTGNKSNDEMAQESLLEARKVLYAHLIDMHKVVLTWRERLLAGYATVVAALAFAYSWAYKSDNSVYFSTTVCIAGTLLTCVFWLLDRRVRDHYRSFISVGFNIERQLITNHEEQPVGVYTAIYLSDKERKAMNIVCRLWRWATSHSGAINMLATGVLIGVLILLFCPPKHSSHTQTASMPIEASVENAPAVSPSSQDK